jgi:ADP-heptose:LPS heptosyltransferase
MNRSVPRLLMLRLAGALLRRLQPPRALPSPPRSVLIIRPDHLGDVLLSRPAIDRLCAAWPQARVTVAVGPWGRAALGRADGFDVLICPFPGVSRRGAGPLQPYLLLLRYARLLRRAGAYDMAIVLRPDYWWGAWLAALAGIPRRIGYDTPETRPFLSDVLPFAPDRHVARLSLDLVALALSLAGIDSDLDVDESASLPAISGPRENRAVDRVLHDGGIGDRPLVVLHPGSNATLKSWPLDNFVALGNNLAQTLGAAIVVTGSHDEWSQAQALRDALPLGTLNLAGSLSWVELEALLRRAVLVVGVDTGPLHLAAAAGTPSVVLFGPADPARFGPWAPPRSHRVVTADLPCRPCHNLHYCHLEPGVMGPPPCMRAIGVRTVLAEARSAIAAGRT